MHFNQKASELFCWVRENRTNLVCFSMYLSVCVQKVHYTAVLAKAKLFLDYPGKLPLNGNLRLCKITTDVYFKNISKLSLTFAFIKAFGDNIKLSRILFFGLIFPHIQ